MAPITYFSDPFIIDLPAPAAASDPYIKTRSGTIVPFSDPQLGDIKFFDIALAISNTFRFTGHATVTVAQHTQEVGRKMMDHFERDDPERKEAGLVGTAHDFVETYIGDMSSPLKRVVRGDYKTIEHRFQGVIYERFGLRKALDRYYEMMKAADMECLYEDAIRCGMDGVEYDACYGEDVNVPRYWVPADFVPKLSNVIWSPREAELRLWKMFVSLMVSTGRGALL